MGVAKTGVYWINTADDLLRQVRHNAPSQGP